MSGLDFRETCKLQQQIRRMEREFDAFIKLFLLRQALDALARTKENTPVDTGLLRAAWTVGDGVSAARGRYAGGKVRYSEDADSSSAATVDSVQRVGDGLVVTLYNPVEYASFVEYGHMNRSRTNWVEGRFMCTLAIDEVARLIPQRFQGEFAAWAGRLGR